MGSIYHSSVVSTTQSASDNDDANIDFSSQHDVSATYRQCCTLFYLPVTHCAQQGICKGYVGGWYAGLCPRYGGLFQ